MSRAARVGFWLPLFLACLLLLSACADRKHEMKAVSKTFAAKQEALLQAPAHAPDLRQDLEHNTDAYAHIQENPSHLAKQTPLSTFSIDVDSASYSNVRRFLFQERKLPPADAVRIEELVNYFRYGDPGPEAGKPVAIGTEVGPCPWNKDHKLVRIGLKAVSIPLEQQPPRNLVFLLDTSGSMQSPDRLPLLKQGLGMLVDTLRPEDRVAIVAYAGSAGLVLESTPGTMKGRIHAALERLHAGGSTTCKSWPRM